jgi:hypothetical protein
VEHQLLGPPDGEGGNHDRPAAGDGVRDHALELRRNRLGVVAAATVGGLDDDVVGVLDRRRIRQDRRAVAAEVAREHRPAPAAPLVDLERDDRRAEDVAGARERHPDAGSEVHGLRVGDPFDLPRRRLALGGGVEGQGRAVLRGAALVVIGGLLFLEVARVGQEQRQEVGRRPGGEDAPPEALLEEPGQVAAVVDVGVREHDPVERGGVDGQPIPVPQAELLEPLVEAAIEEQAPARRLHQELRAGHRADPAQELDRGHWPPYPRAAGRRPARPPGRHGQA